MTIHFPCPVCSKGCQSVLFHKDNYPYLQCTHCSLVFVGLSDKDLASQQNLDIYDQEKYKGNEPTKPPKYKEKKHFRVLKRLEPYKKTEKILDLGCGHGPFLHSSSKKGWKPEGLELSPSLANFIQKHYGYPVHVGFLKEVNLPKNSFDVVHMNELMEHILDPKDLIQNIHSILRPGGVIFLRTRNPDSWTAKYCKDKWKHFSFTKLGHVCFYSPKSFHYLFSHLGFKIVSLKTWGCSFDSIYQKKTFSYKLAKTINKPASFLASLLHKGHRIEVMAEKLK